MTKTTEKKPRHTFTQRFGWEETGDIEEATLDMVKAVVPDGEFSGMVKVTVEYFPKSQFNGKNGNGYQPYSINKLGSPPKGE